MVACIRLVVRWGVIAALCAVMSIAHAVGAPAGKLLINQAQAEFTDARGIRVVVLSNEVAVEVAAVYALSVSPEESLLPGTPGVPLEYLHELRYLGNAPATIRFDGGPTDMALQGVLLAVDRNGDGVRQSTEVIGASEALSAAPGDSWRVWVTVPVPASLPELAVAGWRWRAVLVEAPEAVVVTDRFKVVITPTLSLTASVAPSESEPGEVARFSADLRNTGLIGVAGITARVDGAERDGLYVRLPVPSNTTYVAAHVGVGEVLYRLAGHGLREYTAQLPANPDEIAEVIWRLPSLPAGASGQIDVDVRAAPQMPPSIATRFTLDYALQGAGQSIDSQDLIVRYPEGDHNLGIVDEGFLTSLLYVSVDSQFNIDIQSPRCNRDRTLAERYPVRLQTRVSGDSESGLEVVETDANSGRFRLAGVSVDAWPENPVRVDSDRVEAARDDVISVEFQCPVDLLTGEIAVAGSALVFDSLSGAGIAGADVRLQQLVQGSWQDAQLRDAVGEPISPQQMTDAQGRFRFGVGGAGTYRVIVSKSGYRFPSVVADLDLPQPNQVQAGYSRGEATAKDAPAKFVADLPLDPVAEGGLLLSKKADKREVRAGDRVKYQLTIRHGRPYAWPAAMLVDRQDAELALLPASVRVNDEPATPKQTAGGWTLALPALAAGADTVITYDAIVRQGTDRELENRATVTSPFGASNPALVITRRQSDISTGDTVLLIDAYQDCNGDGERGADEGGVPGVRFYLPSGRFVFTDDRGLAHVAGVEARGTVLRLDETTLPTGMTAPLSGPLASRRVAQALLPLQQQVLRRESFALQGCDSDTETALRKRLAAWSKADTEEAVISDKMVSANTDKGREANVEALPATEILSKQKALFDVPVAQAAQESGQRFADVPFTADLSQLVLAMDKAIGFVDLQDGAVLRDRQLTVRVKGRAGTTMILSVNGAEVLASQVGQQVVYGRGGVQALEYVGVPLQPGKNRLDLIQKDPFGNSRGSAAIAVWAPGVVSKIAIVHDPALAISDGRTPFRFRVQLRDADDRLVPEAGIATVTVSSGTLDADDVDELTPGTQIRLQDGEALVAMSPVAEPKSIELHAAVGTRDVRLAVAFKPHMRPLIATGLVEALWQGGDIEAIGEIEAHEFGWPSTVQSDRVQLFVKGRIKGDRLLTLAYDSDKISDARAMRQLDPERYYPVYGDRSVAGYDAQSSGKLYLRLEDDNELWLLGDFATDPENEVIKLGAHREVGHGIKARFGAQPNRFFSVYAQQHAGGLVVQEFAGTGIGPYALTAEPTLSGETVSIVVRSATNREQVLSETTLAPHIDYTLDPFAQVVYLREPLLGFDEDFNPVSLRVSYRAEQGIERTLAGMEVSLPLTAELTAFATAHGEQDAFDALGSVGLSYQASEHNALVVERAASRDGDTGGDAVRAEWRFRAEKTQGRVEWQDIGEGFQNPTALSAKAGQQWRSTLRYELAPGHTTSLDLRQDKPDEGSETRSALWRNNRHYERFDLDAGVRVTQHDGNEIASAVIRGDYSPEAVPALSVFAETEKAVQDVEDRLTLGADYRLENQARAYFKQDIAGSEAAFADPGNAQSGRRQTVLGLRTGSTKSTEWYSEYRAQTGGAARPDAVDSETADMVLGVRRMWDINASWSVDGGVERSQAMAGEQGDTLALFTGVRYREDGEQWRWRGEHRAGQESRYDHASVAVASRLNADWTALLRFAAEDSQHNDKDNVRVRAGLGLAYRPVATDATSWLMSVNHQHQDGQEATGRLEWVSQGSHPLSRRFRLATFFGWLDVTASDYRYRAFHGALQPEWLVSESFYAGARLGYYRDNLGGDTAVAGAEIGYRVGESLVSVGYNGLGSRADEAPKPAAEGFYLRLRLPLDEQWLGWLAP